jgi:hypothetical protein
VDLHLGTLESMHPFLPKRLASHYEHQVALGLQRHGHVSGVNLKVKMPAEEARFTESFGRRSTRQSSSRWTIIVSRRRQLRE